MSTANFYSSFNMVCIHSVIKLGLPEASQPLSFFLHFRGSKNQFSHKDSSKCTLLREMGKTSLQNTVVLVNVVSFSCEKELGKAFSAKLQIVWNIWFLILLKSKTWPKFLESFSELHKHSCIMKHSTEESCPDLWFWMDTIQNLWIFHKIRWNLVILTEGFIWISGFWHQRRQKMQSLHGLHGLQSKPRVGRKTKIFWNPIKEDEQDICYPQILWDNNIN